MIDGRTDQLSEAALTRWELIIVFNWFDELRRLVPDGSVADGCFGRKDSFLYLAYHKRTQTL